MEKSIEQALITWYPKGHPLHLDLLHPAIGWAGEGGELVDLLKKQLFKGGVSWWDCVHCGESGDWHSKNNSFCGNGWIESRHTVYTPKVLDELGDFGYYQRIINYISKHPDCKFDSEVDEITILLADLNLYSAQLLVDLIHRRKIDTGRLKLAQQRFDRILEIFDCSLDQLTELNWQKLKDGDHHGWATARKLPQSL